MAGGSASRLSQGRNEVSGFGSNVGSDQDRNLATRESCGFQPAENRRGLTRLVGEICIRDQEVGT